MCAYASVDGLHLNISKHTHTEGKLISMNNRNRFFSLPQRASSSFVVADSNILSQSNSGDGGGDEMEESIDSSCSLLEETLTPALIVYRCINTCSIGR